MPISLEAEVSSINIHDQMTLHVKGPDWPFNVLRLPLEPGVAVGDRFVIVLSKVEIEQEQSA